MKLEERKQKLREDEFWIAVEELTQLIKGYREPLKNILLKENKDTEEELFCANFRLLSYELKEMRIK